MARRRRATPRRPRDRTCIPGFASLAAGVGLSALVAAGCFYVPSDGGGFVFTCREDPPECPPETICLAGVCTPLESSGSDAGEAGTPLDAAAGTDAGAPPADSGPGTDAAGR